MSVNKVILIGRLGKDVEIKFMTNGEAVANTSLATSENWKDKAGEKHEKTEWHNLVFYRRLAEIAGEYLKKGAQIYVEGKLQTRKWQDKETGQDRYMTEIIVNDMKMLGSKSENESGNFVGGSAPHPSSHPDSQDHVGRGDKSGLDGDRPGPAGKGGSDNFDSDIPF